MYIKSVCIYQLRIPFRQGFHHARQRREESDAVRNLSLLEPFRLVCIQQPVVPGGLQGLTQVREKTAIPVVAEESLVNLAQAQELVRLNACDLFNIRVSNMNSSLILFTVGLSSQ